MPRRPIESALYAQLVETEYSFVERGERTIIEIYEAVQHQFPDLCDDRYLCINHCQSGSNQPEWKHVVRTALGRLKNKINTLEYTGLRGYWNFN